MNCISNIVVGATPSTASIDYWANGTIPWLPSGCCQDGEVTESYHAMKMISQKGYDSCSTTMMKPETVLIALTGATAGKVGLLKFNACANQSVVGVSGFIGLEPKFIFYQFMARRQEILSDCIGSAQPHISKDYITKMYFALPSFDEQKRIVKKIETFEPLLAEYDKLEQQATKLDEDIYDNLKKSILQYAIQGKLVAQDPNDEPASVLLAKIREEKKKQLGKKYVESYIFKGDDNCYYEHINGKDINISDDIPFDLPDNWCWSRLIDVVDVRDGTHDTPKYVESGYPLVTSKNLCDGKIDFSSIKYISENDYLEINKRSCVDDGDILFAMIGSIGNPVKVKKHCEFAIKNMALFKPYSISVNMDYIYNFLKIIQEVMKKQASGAVQQFVSLNFLRNYFIPVPPLAEQQRIVKRINEIFTLL